MIKYVAGVGTAGAVNIGLFNSASIALFNVPILVPIMACSGALLSFAYDDDSRPKTRISKKKAAFLVLANTLITTAAVSVFPDLFGWTWFSGKLQGSVALLIAASARFTIPLIIKTLPEIVRKWFKVGEYNKTEGDTDETK